MWRYQKDNLRLGLPSIAAKTADMYGYTIEARNEKLVFHLF